MGWLLGRGVCILRAFHGPLWKNRNNNTLRWPITADCQMALAAVRCNHGSIAWLTRLEGGHGELCRAVVSFGALDFVGLLYVPSFNILGKHR